MDGIVCEIENCDRDAYSGNLCKVHYDQRQRGTLGVYVTRPKYCMHPTCENKHEAKGLCRVHYRQYVNEGLEMPFIVGRSVNKCAVAECSSTCYGQTIFCRDHAKERGVHVTRTHAADAPRCTVEGCNHAKTSRGLCVKHYQETLRRRQGKRINIQGQVGCRVGGCGNKHKAKGYCQRHYSILKTFGIDPQIYQNLLVAQLGLCAVCKSPSGKKGLHLDHNHQTLEVRSLLCYKCNATLGLLNENPYYFEALAEYARTDGKCILTRSYGVYTDPVPIRDR